MPLDDTLKTHLNYLFNRDALVIFENNLTDKSNSTQFFENLQSTNWNSVRFKPPPSLHSDLPWRVELRTMEVQKTMQENANLIFLSLKLASLFFKDMFNLYLPISYVTL
jgi:glutamate--cysteine ligase catalytic subunit